MHYPWNLPLQTQARVDPQHGHTNYIFVYLLMQWKSKEKWQIQAHAENIIIFYYGREYFEHWISESLNKDYTG